MTNVFRYFNRILVHNNYGFIQRNIRSASTISLSTDKKSLPEEYDKSQAVRHIQKLLNVHMRYALQVVNENRKLTATSPFLLSKNVEILNDYDIDALTVLKYPHLLVVTDLKEAIEELKKLPFPLDVTIVLAGLPTHMLSLFIKSYASAEDRISKLSNLFKISHTQACEFLYQRNFLISKDLEALEKVLTLVLEFGISLEDLWKDPWILRYRPDIVKERIEFITDAQVEFLTPPKPWMLRSPIEAIENYFKRRQDNKKILGSSSLTEYLCDKLQCSEDQVKYMMLKIPALKTKSLRTLSDIINFLYSRGFKPYHIYRVPKILVHSVETTKKRLEMMESAGITVDSLHMLTKSQTQFMQNFELILKSKKKS